MFNDRGPSPASQIPEPAMDRPCFRVAIPEIPVAAGYLDEAVTNHISKRPGIAEALIRQADMPAIREWTESVWGKASTYIQYRKVAGAPPYLAREQRVPVRMPSAADRHLLHLRDGYHCRFCGIPVIRKEIRHRLRGVYPLALQWGRTNASCHAAFQAMWAQYDHILPHVRGGKNNLENIVVTCAPCNYGRMSYTLDEVGLLDPRTREPIRSEWDGLERLLHCREIAQPREIAGKSLSLGKSLGKSLREITQPDLSHLSETATQARTP